MANGKTNLEDKYICPFDSKHAVQRPLGDLAKHMGLKEDKLHEDWRKRHGLPAKMEMGSVNKKQFEIIQAIVDDKDTFHRINF